MPSLTVERATALLQEAVKVTKALDKARREKAIRNGKEEMAKLFRKQGALFLAKLPKYADRFLAPQARKEAMREAVGEDLADDFADIFGLTRREADDVMAMMLMDGLKAGYLEQATSFGLDLAFKLPNERAVAWAEKNAAAKVTKINAATQDEIRGIITRGLEEGTSYGEVAREIKGRFEDFSTKRSELVAVTENAEAMEEGGLSLAREVQDAGIDMEKSWLVANDERLCPICEENGRVGWIPLDEDYPDGSEHPPSHPGCRCAGLHRMKE